METLSNGKHLWIGTFMSARMGWKLRLNIDMVVKPAYDTSNSILQNDD